MMKILTINGSYRRNGNTQRVMERVCAELVRIANQRGEPLEIETINLARQNIQPCHGCRVCFDRGEQFCPVQDDMPAIKASMQAADGILLASPVYVDDVSGQVKTWMDRLAHVCHRPEFADKCIYLIATVATSPTGHTLRTMSMAARTWGFHVAGQAGLKMGALAEWETFEAQYGPRCDRIAGRFHQAVARRDFMRPSFISLLTFKIQQLAWQTSAADSIDYRYWQEKGWLNPRREFYIPHAAGAIKVGLARLAGAILARFVL